MQNLLKTLVCALSAVLLCSACTRISLTKGGSGSSSPPASGGGFSLPSINFGNSAPPLNGEWHVTYLYNGAEYESSITFVQNGSVLSGNGSDSTGMKFYVTDGKVDGHKVHFVKKYMDADPSKQPVAYDGELTYSDDADFKGWSLGGHYKAKINDKTVDDKWVAVSAASEPTQPQPVAQNPAPVEQNPGGEPQADPAQQDDGEAVDNITGMFTANYDYNFKRIETRLWLKQTGNTVTGDGTDTNTGEYFVISKGFCNAPRVMLKCHYEKGKHANSTRDLTIRAVIGSAATLKGETQYGSPWTATFVR
jgi:hypothetical protein